MKMTIEQIIAAFEQLRADDPEGFYLAFGNHPCDLFLKYSFFRGAYEMGLVIGAKYALEHWVNEEPKGSYEVNAELKRPISGADLMKVVKHSQGEGGCKS